MTTKRLHREIDRLTHELVLVRNDLNLMRKARDAAEDRAAKLAVQLTWAQTAINGIRADLAWFEQGAPK
jgi:hypothetical protein